MNRKERGQGLVEYALILVLVAIVVIAIWLLVGPAIGDVFCNIIEAMDDSYACDGGTSVSVATTMDSGQQPPLECEDAKEKILVLWEEAKAQEEGLREGVDFALEAVVESFEVLIDYADDLNQQELSAGLSLLIQNIQSGDIGGIPEAIVALGSCMEDVPLEVWTAVSLEMAPSLIDSCEAVSGGLVSPDTIAAAQEAVEQLDDDYPGKAVIQQLLDEAVGIIEERDVFSQDWLAAICTAVVVDIDIKPGGDPNSINLGSPGVVPVAVLTTDDFDASTIDPATVVLAGAWPLRWTIEDVDFDGDGDLLFHFKTQELDLDENSTEATLIGKTVDGQAVYGTDSVNIVP